MTWKCPHGKYVKVKFIANVAIYYHDDGEECELLNSFNVKVSDIDDTTYKSDPKKYGFILCDSKASINELIMRLETATNPNELLGLLKSIVDILPYVGEKLAREFGKIFYENVKLTGYVDYETLRAIRSAADKVQKPKHRMLWLQKQTPYVKEMV